MLMTIPSPSAPSQDQNLTITWPSPTFSNICHRIFKALNSALLCQKYAMVGWSVWICHLQRTWMNCWDRLKNMLCPERVFTRPSRQGLVCSEPKVVFWPTEKPLCHFIIWPVVAMAAVWRTLPRSQGPISWQDTDTGPISWQWKCLQKHSDSLDDKYLTWSTLSKV